MTRLTIEIPDSLLSTLALAGQPVQDAIVRALERYVVEQYAETAVSASILQTQTWQLCGALDVSAPDPQAIVGQDKQGNAITNYAEHIDDVLY